MKERGYNKAIIIEKLAERAGVSKKEASRVFHAWIALMMTGMIEQKKIVLSDFGVFQISTRKPFRGYDPMNDCMIDVPKRYVPVFKVGKGLKARLNDEEIL